MEFDKLLLLHKDSIYRQLVRTCGNREDAEDALVESLVSAWQAADRLENPEAFRGWIGTIARRACSHIRRNERISFIVGDEVLEAVSQAETAQIELEMKQMKSCIQSAISILDPDQRSVYEMRELQGLSTDEVAERIGITSAAVKSRLHRAREIVREALDQSVCAS